MVNSFSLSLPSQLWVWKGVVVHGNGKHGGVTKHTPEAQSRWDKRSISFYLVARQLKGAKGPEMVHALEPLVGPPEREVLVEVLQDFGFEVRRDDGGRLWVSDDPVKAHRQ